MISLRPAAFCLLLAGLPLCAGEAPTAPSAGRFQLVAAQVTDHDGTRSRLFRLDTMTGEVSEFISVGFPARDASGQTTMITARGWTPIPADFWAECDRVKALAAGARGASPPPISGLPPAPSPAAR
jgi:hypothetical protein